MEEKLFGEFRILPLTIRHKLNSFDSSNIDLNDFLKNDALKYQEEMAGRTYLCCGKKDIIGYVTLVTDTLEVHAVDEKDRINGYPYQKFPCIRIARLAVDKRFERKGVGRFLLSVAIGKAISISNEIGCRYITVDSKPESLGFYEKHNFKTVKKYMHSKYPKMYLDMYPIATLMRSKESLEY